MYLQALATAVPDARYTQRDCWSVIENSGVKGRLSRRSRLLLHAILTGDNGIDSRHFAVPDIEHVFDLNTDLLHGAFRQAAPVLARKALLKALDSAGIQASEIDALLVCTCTGYLCPGLTSYVAESLGLRNNLIMQDLVGLGCGAAIPTLRAASHLLAASPGKTVACIAVEVCSAAFYLDDDPGVLISACLFADGAAATLWRTAPGPGGLRCFGFESLHMPDERDKLRFEMRDGKLRNLLDRTVPKIAAHAVGKLWASRGPRPVGGVVAHPGGRDVIEAIEPVVAPHSLASSANVLRRFGNLSSPSVLFVLEQALGSGMPKSGDLWLVSFGAGFSAHACRIGS
jgi:predicted naringenin-chalcone synthase